MAMSGASDKKAIQSEINVTPLIDVLLVLLIIFLVVMPIMMKMETLQIPRKISDNEAPDPNATLLTVRVKATGDVVFIENEKETPIQAAELMRMLRPKLEAIAARNAEKVVFVDFEDGVLWSGVVSTMDSIRSLATDVNHDDVKVALKVKEDPK
jgi:biopolymer transport protein ExbD